MVIFSVWETLPPAELSRSIFHVIKIPKIALPIQVAAHGHDADSMKLYISPSRSDVGRRQKLVELVENSNQFLPVEDANGNFILVNKKELVWISLAAGSPLTGALSSEEEELAPMELYDLQYQVRIRFTDDKLLEGVILYSPPADRARLSDYVNSGRNFMHLWLGDLFYVVNKRHIWQVEELSSS